ncbi:MAG: DUF2252 domain-containing protein [Ignavibacterium sp.]|jgi:uncharacterized protein (DUF2252 family)|nr:DUF2252 domain-containing protein [Ignavibacterium sp.]
MSKKLLDHLQSKKLSIEERIVAGKKLRDKFPRIKQGEYKPAVNRIDPVSILEEQAKTRLPELVPVRYARMLGSPFAFLRGGAAIMAVDLAANGKTTGINVQACGDMHIANFGVFASAERNLVFGINDFDETLPGPWEWDLKRLVASIVAAGRFFGVNRVKCQESVMSAVSTYRKKIRQYAYMGNLELWYSTIDENDILKSLTQSARAGAEKIMSKARQRTHMQVLGKLTDLVDEKYLLKENAPFIVRETKTQTGRPIKEALGIFFESYFNSLADDRKTLIKNYRIVDAARKVVGVGSVGTRCWIIFMIGNNSDDPLFLQLKEAQPSVLEPYLSKSIYPNQGQRVVAGQRLIQGAPDIFLGWGEIDGMQYYVRQLRDMKGGVEFDPNKVKVENLDQYSSLCAWALALAHAKSGDAAMIAGYAGKSDELDAAMVNFAFAYADQTEKDYQALASAAKSGRIKVASISE